MNEFEHSTRINALLAKLKAKEPKAREELIAHILEWLQGLLLRTQNLRLQPFSFRHQHFRLKKSQ